VHTNVLTEAPVFAHAMGREAGFLFDGAAIDGSHVDEGRSGSAMPRSAMSLMTKPETEPETAPFQYA